MLAHGHPITLKKCVLVNTNNHWLATTPDSKVIDHSCEEVFGLVEVKCLEGKKDEDPTVIATNANSSLDFIPEVKLCIRKNNIYYA